MIKQESDLTNHRLTWLATLQGFLFAALDFAWDKGQGLIPVLVIVGIVSSVSVLVALIFADQAIRGLVQQWQNNKSPNYKGPDIIGFAPVRRVYAFVLPWFLLPFLFAVTWAVIPFVSHK